MSGCNRKRGSGQAMAETVGAAESARPIRFGIMCRGVALADRQRVEPRVSAGAAGWSAGGVVPGEQGGQALIAIQGGR